MVEDLISGIVYTELDDEVGPDPKLWIPTDLSEHIKMQVSIKSVTLLTGEVDIPKRIVIIPFTSLNLKGISKFIQWEDETRRGGVGRTILTLLFNDIDDLIFYKYIEELEELFTEIGGFLKNLEKSKAPKEELLKIIETFKVDLIQTLKELRDNEISSKNKEIFPEDDIEGKETPDYSFKIVICGDKEVGKTSLVLRFTDSAFQRSYKPTIGVNISKKLVNLDDALIQLIIWDIAGQTQFDTMRKLFYQGADGVILLFDLTNFNTFNNCYNWFKDIKNNLPKEKPLCGFLIGNKNDLIEERIINPQVAEGLAKDINLEFTETSALTGENVEYVFYQIAEFLIKNM